jgi:hypothetical protein
MIIIILLESNIESLIMAFDKKTHKTEKTKKHHKIPPLILNSSDEEIKSDVFIMPSPFSFGLPRAYEAALEYDKKHPNTKFYMESCPVDLKKIILPLAIQQKIEISEYVSEFISKCKR